MARLDKEKTTERGNALEPGTLPVCARTPRMFVTGKSIYIKLYTLR